MYAYQKYNDGQMNDYIPTEEELAAMKNEVESE